VNELAFEKRRLQSLRDFLAATAHFWLKRELHLDLGNQCVGSSLYGLAGLSRALSGHANARQIEPWREREFFLEVNGRPTMLFFDAILLVAFAFNGPIFG
jgi:hypothetical protein